MFQLSKKFYIKVPAVRRISQATGSVGGSFALQWNSQILNGKNKTFMK